MIMAALFVIGRISYNRETMVHTIRSKKEKIRDKHKNLEGNLGHHAQ